MTTAKLAWITGVLCTILLFFNITIMLTYLHKKTRNSPYQFTSKTTACTCLLLCVGMANAIKGVDHELLDNKPFHC